MLRPLVAIVLLILSGITIGSETGNGEIVTYKTDGDYQMVRESVEIAIIGQGLIINGTLHVQEMLDRTAKDLGYTKNIYSAAESFEFCDTSITHQMTLVDPRNITTCPFNISVYQLVSDPDHVYVAYRKPVFIGDSSEVEKKALKLLDDISREAIE